MITIKTVSIVLVYISLGFTISKLVGGSAEFWIKQINVVLDHI